MKCPSLMIMHYSLSVLSQDSFETAIYRDNHVINGSALMNQLMQLLGFHKVEMIIIIVNGIYVLTFSIDYVRKWQYPCMHGTPPGCRTNKLFSMRISCSI